MKVQLYIEGAGQKAADIRLREGFRGLIAHDSGEETARSVRIVACGNTNQTYRDFCNGIRTSIQPQTCFAILVDSDAPVGKTADAWQILSQLNGGGSRPAGADPDCAHLMVQIMESWIATDTDNLARYYGQEFNAKPLDLNPDVEQVSKADIYARLKDATKNSQKQEYHKTQHGFDLIKGIDPRKLRTRSRRASNFLDFVKTRVKN